MVKLPEAFWFLVGKEAVKTSCERKCHGILKTSAEMASDLQHKPAKWETTLLIFFYDGECKSKMESTKIF